MSSATRRTLVAGLLVTIAHVAHAQARVPADTLRWMAGCWSSSRGGVTIEESWMAPRAGVLLGVGRTSDAAHVQEFEFLRIYASHDTLVYAATPSGQAHAEFRAKTIAPGEIVFENPTHDFPTRVGYRRVGADSLIAFIEGMRGGSLRTIRFPYRKVPCPT